MAPKLNSATDEASAVIREVERFLGEELSIGVSGKSDPFAQRVGEPTEDGSATTIFSYLVYGRVAGKHRSYVVESLEREHEDVVGWDVISEDHTPWSSCSREVKLASFAKLPDLLGKIADEAEKLSRETVETSKTVRDILGS